MGSIDNTVGLPSRSNGSSSSPSKLRAITVQAPTLSAANET